MCSLPADDYDFEDIETTKLRHGIKVRKLNPEP
jgi:hypothetical protein